MSYQGRGNCLNPECPQKLGGLPPRIPDSVSIACNAASERDRIFERRGIEEREFRFAVAMSIASGFDADPVHNAGGRHNPEFQLAHNGNVIERQVEVMYTTPPTSHPYPCLPKDGLLEHEQNISDESILTGAQTKVRRRWNKTKQPQVTLEHVEDCGLTSILQPSKRKTIQARRADVGTVHKRLEKITAASQPQDCKRAYRLCKDLLDLLLSKRGGMLLAVVSKLIKRLDLDFALVDSGRLQECFNKVGRNYFNQQQNFTALLQAIRQHTDRDRWEQQHIDALGQQCEPNGSVDDASIQALIQALADQPKDGAVLMSLGGTVMASGAKLRLDEWSQYDLKKSDGSGAGCRHAAGIALVEYMQCQQVLGVVFCASDSGSVSVMFPAEDIEDPPLVYELDSKR